jgi:hypothetical protein
VHVNFVYFVDLPEQVLLIDTVAVLIELGQLLLDKATHLENAKHLLSFVHQREVVGQQLYLVGVRVLPNDLKVE